MLLVDLKPPLAVVPEGWYLLAVGIFGIILYDERAWQFAVNLEVHQAAAWWRMQEEYYRRL